MTSWPPDTAVCIPSYKSAQLLAQLLPRVRKYVPAGNIVVVDDASHDGTREVCTGHQVRYLRHALNRGKGAALKTGFHYCIAAGLKWVITMDADGQHDPADLPKFLVESKRSPAPGICIGARLMQPGIMPPERILSNRITSGILSLFCGIPIADSQCGFRLYSVDFLIRTEIFYRRFEMESEIILKAAFMGFPVTFITIQTVYLRGPSHISHVADTIRWIIAVMRIRLQRRSIIYRNNYQPPVQTG